MVFSSTVFLFLFLPALLIFYYLPVGRKEGTRRGWRNGVLLIFSIGFYAWGEPVFVFLMLVSVLINWFAGILIGNRPEHRKLWMLAAVVFDIALLAVFKYTGFLSENLAVLFGNDSLVVEIALPVGISFFTFQMMSYVFDVYYGNAKVQRNPFYVALYITLFPQLIAGPIVRYTEVEEDICGRKETFEGFVSGLKRFVYGLGKKALLANFLAMIADNTFDYTGNPSVMMAWLGAIAYSLQIYYDFSGYSDMAIGLGRMFGFRFAENFNYPYMAAGITDFWRRWHISLSTWFRDYVYIPMGGNRVKKSRWVLNLFTVWLLTGIWHGAEWTFVLWGLIWFVCLLLEKLAASGRKAKADGTAGRRTGPEEEGARTAAASRPLAAVSAMRAVLSHVYTLLIIVLAWVFFRAENVKAAVSYIGRMFGAGASGFAGTDFFACLKGTWIVLAMGIIGAFPLVGRIFGKLEKKNLAFIEYVWLTAVFAVSVLCVISESYNPFIYFNF